MPLCRVAVRYHVLPALVPPDPLLPHPYWVVPPLGMIVVIDCGVLEQMKFEIRYTSREDEPDLPWFGMFPTPNNWALLSDTGNVALPSKQELTEGKARCFEILAARTLVLMTGTANPE